MSLISVNQLTFYYDGSPDNIFEELTVQIDTDWKLGLVARNGRGKTTFLKLLANSVKSNAGGFANKAMRETYEYRGSISSPVEFDYFPFETEDITRITLELTEELYPSCELWKICRELTLLKVEAEVLYRPFDTLSNGERTKVMMAVLFSMDNKFLLIDEPTNHLDMEARKMVGEYLNRKRGFILVSHDRNFMDGCVDHILAFNRNSVEVCQGNFSTWWENRQRKDAWEKAENDRLRKDIARLGQSATEKTRWAENVEASKIGSKSFKQGGRIGQQGDKIASRDFIGEKSRRMQQRRKSLEMRMQREMDEKSGLLKDLETVEDLKLYPLVHDKNVLVRLEDVRIYYGNTADTAESGASQALGQGQNKSLKEAQPTPKKLGKINLQIKNGGIVLCSRVEMGAESPV